MDMRQALERLCTCTAPSGFEAPAAAVAAELLRPLVDEVSVDRMGNVLGVRRCGKEGAPRLLLDAHLDEIGLLVTGVEDGFLRFRSIGGVDPRMLPGRELVVLTDPPRRGIVTCPAGGEADKSIPLSELFVDVGLSQTEAERAVPVGTPMVYRGGCFALGEDQMCGKSMDDRSCFVTLLRAAELLRDLALGRTPPQDLHTGGGFRGGRHGRHLGGSARLLRGGGRDPRQNPRRPGGQGLRHWRRSRHRRGPQHDPLDDRPDARQGEGEADSLPTGGHVRPHRHQRLGDADQPGRGSHLGAVPAAEVYAFPH